MGFSRALHAYIDEVVGEVYSRLLEKGVRTIGRKQKEWLLTLCYWVRKCFAEVRVEMNAEVREVWVRSCVCVAVSNI